MPEKSSTSPFTLALNVAAPLRWGVPAALRRQLFAHTARTRQQSAVALQATPVVAREANPLVHIARRALFISGSFLGKSARIIVSLPHEREQGGGVDEQWRSAAVALEEVRHQELSKLSEQDSADLFNRCAMSAGDYWISPERSQASGLVAQQNFF